MSFDPTSLMPLVQQMFNRATGVELRHEFVARLGDSVFSHFFSDVYI